MGIGKGRGVGCGDGGRDGRRVGSGDGSEEGVVVGSGGVGIDVGVIVGRLDGCSVGSGDGSFVEDVGIDVGAHVISSPQHRAE